MKVFAKLCAVFGIALCGLPLPAIIFEYLGRLSDPKVTLGAMLADARVLPFLVWGAGFYLLGTGILRTLGIKTKSYFLFGTVACYTPILFPDQYPFLFFTALMMTTWSIFVSLQIARAKPRTAALAAAK